MPFTVSHAAAALPIRALLGPRVDFVALVVGCLAPDFPYYVGGAFLRGWTHHPSAILWFCIPAGLLVFWLYESLLRRAVWDLLPEPIRARTTPERTQPVRFGAVVAGLALGAATHVAWDAFTHNGGVVRHLGLDWHLATVAGYRVFSYKVLQHGSTLFGAAVLAAAAGRWLLERPGNPLPDEPPPVGTRRARTRILLVVVPFAFGLSVAIALAPPIVGLTTLAYWIAHVVVSGITAGIAILVAYGWRLRSEAPAPSTGVPR